MLVAAPEQTFAKLEVDAVKRLQAAGCDSAARDASLLLQAASGLDKGELISKATDPCLSQIKTLFESYVTARSNKMPTHRILGEREFHGLQLLLSEATLEPRDDTECLIETSLFQLEDRDGKLKFLDLGTGTGAVALALLSELPNANAVATDVSFEALETAQRNAVSNGYGERFETLQSSWFDEVEERYDFITSNPPYIASSVVDGLEPEVLLHDPRLALDGGDDGLHAYRSIVKHAQAFLKEGGFVAFEIGHDQKPAVCELAEQSGWQIIATTKDLSGCDRVVVIAPQTNSSIAATSTADEVGI